MNKEFLLKNAIVDEDYIYFEEDCAASLFLFDAPQALAIYAKHNRENAEKIFQSCKNLVESWFPNYFLKTEAV